MAGLVGYASSDEEEDEESVSSQPPLAETVSEQKHSSNQSKIEANGTLLSDEQGALPAPMQGPARPLDDTTLFPPLDEGEEMVADEEEAGEGPSSFPRFEPPLGADGRPLSPYSADRALIHHLTLPTVPNLDIPPSPPGSPPAALNKKFEQFADLKYKQGVHFNAKLEASRALKNPSLMDKLMSFVELEGVSQYETTLGTDLWNPRAFPDSAYRGALRKSQRKIDKEREAAKADITRSLIDFVPSTSGAAPMNGGSLEGGLSRRSEKKKNNWG